MRWALAVLVLLIGCTAGEPAPEVASYRDRTVPIASQADVDIEDIIGPWSLVWFAGPRIDDGLVLIRYDDRNKRLFFIPRLPPDWPEDMQVSFVEDSVLIRPNGPGRFALSSTLRSGEGFSADLLQGRTTAELWVLWADQDRRTLAVGNPEGTFGFILNRGEGDGEDRIAAARDIMAWMGYRTDEMVTR